MKLAMGFAFVCSFSGVSLVGQPLQVQGTKVAFPEGNVIGAALADSRIFVQESVFHSDGPTVRVSRQLLSWSVTDNSLLKKTTIGTAEAALAGDDCGKVEVLEQDQRILVCENYETLTVLDAESLRSLSAIHCVGHIYDFAVDDNLKRVLIALQSDSGAQYLVMLDIGTGKQLGQTKIASGNVDRVRLTADSRTMRVAVAKSRLEHSGYKTDLYGCDYSQTMTCSYIATLPQTSQIAMWGPDVFLASGLLADDRRVCLTKVNLSNHEVTHQYCAPQTGVHYGVGVIDGKYIIGYTGVGKNLAWKEATLTKSNSVSVWRYENGTVAAVAVQQGADGPFQSGARIACAKSPYFLLYSETSNTAYIYTINEIKAN